METNPVVHSTFVLERTYAATPDRVFAAFADPAKKRRWFAEGLSHTLENYALDLRVGGEEHYASRFKEGTPVAGSALTNDSIFHDVVPNRRLVFSSAMAMDGRCFAVSIGTIELLPAGQGTNLVLTFQSAFLEGADGPAMREAGWRTLLDKLATELSVQ